MPAGGNDCDCQCGASACTKWTLGKIQNEIATRLNMSANNGNGPGGDHYYDALNCRHFLEFGYDTPSQTLIVRSQRAPHRDCIDRTIYGGHTFDYPDETCGTADFIDDGSTIEPLSNDCCPGYTATAPAGPPTGTPSTPVVTTVPCYRNAPGGCRGRLTSVLDQQTRPMAVKHIKLKAGWRVRVRLVTDSLINRHNALEGDYTLTSYWSPSWFGAGWAPLAGVMPTSGTQWSMKKACQFQHGKNINQYTDSWPYPGVPEVPTTPSGSSFDSSKGYREYEHRRPAPDATMCVMDNGGSATSPPTDHPTAPLVDRSPAVYGNLITFRHIEAAFDTLYTGATPKPPGSYATDSGSKNYATYGASTNFPIIAQTGNQEDWWLARFYRWPFGSIMKRADFKPGASGDSEWRQSYMSNTAYYQAQPAAGSDITPITAPPYELFMVSVPPISRGWCWSRDGSGNITGGPQILRPTTPIDTARVAEELSTFGGLFSNLTIHEYSPPTFPEDGTIRPRVVTTTSGDLYSATWVSDNPLGYPQTGCSPPAVSDCEIVVEIPKSGTYALFFEENASRVTTHGSTTVATYNVERFDGVGWVAVDLVDICRPSPTPDHHGFVWWTGIEFYAPFKSMGSPGFSSPIRTIDRGTPYCTGASRIHYIMNPLTPTQWGTISGYNTLASRFAGSTYVDHYNTFPTNTQTKAPELIFDQYRNRTAGSYCCGYEVAWYPYVGASCHKDRNLLDCFYTNASGVLDPKVTNGGNVSPPERAWSLGW